AAPAGSRDAPLRTGRRPRLGHPGPSAIAHSRHASITEGTVLPVESRIVSESLFSQDPLALVVAHRGLATSEAENTLEAFAAALDVGADAVEFDVRLTGDGVPIVMHDAAVDRTTDGHGVARSMSLEEIKGLRIATANGSGAEVPTLGETLAALSGR